MQTHRNCTSVALVSQGKDDSSIILRAGTKIVGAKADIGNISGAHVSRTPSLSRYVPLASRYLLALLYGPAYSLD